ncbi:MAG: CheR family methyltransferase [Verrucomicrobiota bacterium]
MLTSEQFDRTRKLALRLAGIELFDRHRELLAARSRRLRLPHAAGIEGLLSAAEEGDPLASRQLIGLVTTNFTGFFRHLGHFDAAADHAIAAVQRRGQARLWSAAAATGEEPYSIAMALIEGFRRDDPPTTVLATDIDADALAAAARGEYGERALKALEAGRREHFLGEPVAERRCIRPAVRRLVEFRALNLAEVIWPVEGPFDVIFCRNVLMYLEACHRYAVFERLASLLASDGLLILDPTEHLGKAGHLFTPGADGLYSRRRLSCPPRSATRECSVLRQ